MLKYVQLVLIFNIIGYISDVESTEFPFLHNHRSDLQQKVPDSGRDFNGGTVIASISDFPYMVYLKYWATLSGIPTELILTGVALNSLWVTINPIALTYHNNLNPDVKNMTVISGSLDPLNQGLKHKVLSSVLVPSIPKIKDQSGVFLDVFMLLRVCPGIECSVYPTIPSTPMSINMQGNILQWVFPSTLSKITKSSVDENQCSFAVSSLQYNSVTMFCLNGDTAVNVCFSGTSDYNGVPFILPGHIFSGMLLAATCDREGMLDLAVFKDDILAAIKRNTV